PKVTSSLPCLRDLTEQHGDGYTTEPCKARAAPRSQAYGDHCHHQQTHTEEQRRRIIEDRRVPELTLWERKRTQTDDKLPACRRQRWAQQCEPRRVLNLQPIPRTDRNCCYYYRQLTRTRLPLEYRP